MFFVVLCLTEQGVSAGIPLGSVSFLSLIEKKKSDVDFVFSTDRFGLGSKRTTRDRETQTPQDHQKDETDEDSVVQPVVSGSGRGRSKPIKNLYIYIYL